MLSFLSLILAYAFAYATAFHYYADAVCLRAAITLLLSFMPMLTDFAITPLRWSHYDASHITPCRCRHAEAFASRHAAITRCLAAFVIAFTLRHAIH